uniref:Uncharacterized protein n=1 Tax=Branchiostoma floridae TaxID=7739 RepID=C3ZUS3_BRAFL|eukprot:XP_002587774.1 hypothetical protein BRAFLDRAFT_94677 [Branchiostoma floridae]
MEGIVAELEAQLSEKEDKIHELEKLCSSLKTLESKTNGVYSTESYPNTHTEELGALLDVKGFLGIVSNDLEQHSCPHTYRYTKGHDEKFGLQYMLLYLVFSVTVKERKVVLSTDGTRTRRLSSSMSGQSRLSKVHHKIKIMKRTYGLVSLNT